MRTKLTEYLIGIKMRGGLLTLEDSGGVRHTIAWTGFDYLLDGRNVFRTERPLCDILIHEGIIYRSAV